MTSKSGGIKGRSKYISDPNRQENLIYAADPIDWKPYRDFEMKNQKSNVPNNEGRELIIALPNVWDELSMEDLVKKTKDLAEVAIEKDTDYQYAVHYNQAKTNLHMHVIFSERSMTGKVEFYKKDVFLQKDGKVARKKSNRAKDHDGNDLPAIHKKGGIKNSGFSEKDIKYKQKGWLQGTKERISDNLKDQGIDIEHPKIFELHQYHEGKGSEAQILNQKNEFIKTANEYLNLANMTGSSEPDLIRQKKNMVSDLMSNTIDDLKDKLNFIKSKLIPPKKESIKFDLSEGNYNQGLRGGENKESVRERIKEVQNERSKNEPPAEKKFVIKQISNHDELQSPDDAKKERKESSKAYNDGHKHRHVHKKNRDDFER